MKLVVIFASMVIIVSQMGTGRFCLVTDYGLKLCAYESIGACQDALMRRDGRGICVPNY